jgi:hypothetical protein
MLEHGMRPIGFAPHMSRFEPGDYRGAQETYASASPRAGLNFDR